MDSIWLQISTIFIAGVTGIWKGIPVGFAMQAHPLLTAGFTALGSITLVMILLLSGEPFKQWILNRYGQKKLERKKGKFSRLVDRYGVAGIGLLGCGVIGPLLSTLLGLIFVRKPKKLIPFLIAGIILWSSGLTAVATLSYQLFKTFI